MISDDITIEDSIIANRIAEDRMLANGTAEDSTLVSGTAEDSTLVSRTTEDRPLSNGTAEDSTLVSRTLGIYIHIPFCRSKCPYCDFYSIILGKRQNEGINLDADYLRKKYVDALTTEIKDFFEKNKGEYCISTIYFGGGTPSLLEVSELRKLLDVIKSNMSEEQHKNCELTIEANPKDVSFKKLEELRSLGFNRLSLGMQSFDDEILKRLGRRHRRVDNIDAFNMARRAGFDNISVDLMFGIPGQSPEIFQKSVELSIELNPEHISLYSLEFMDGTAFTKMLKDGKIKETDEEIDRAMYHTALECLEKNGYRQYEISNVSKPGFESRHNKRYWNHDEYIGFGASAHSFIGNSRFSNISDINLYLDNPLDRLMYEENTIFDEMSIYVFTGLRKNEGVNLHDFMNRFGMDLWVVFEKCKDEFMKYVHDGYAEMSEDRIRLTTKGFDISNKILCLFV